MNPQEMIADRPFSPHGWRWWVKGYLKSALPALGAEDMAKHLTKELGIDGAEGIEVYEGSNGTEWCVRVWSDQPIPELTAPQKPK